MRIGVKVVKNSWGEYDVVVVSGNAEAISASYTSRRDALARAARIRERLKRDKKKNPGVRTASKSAIPSKFVSAKVRRVGGKVQILLNK
jgi:nitroimidazol reductase NimA-like FMN-containing flavoprotein (pyridoxamine 5'-phosphate oxidase superfamily)